MHCLTHRCFLSCPAKLTTFCLAAVCRGGHCPFYWSSTFNSYHRPSYCLTRHLSPKCHYITALQQRTRFICRRQKRSFVLSSACFSSSSNLAQCCTQPPDRSQLCVSPVNTAEHLQNDLADQVPASWQLPDPTVENDQTLSIDQVYGEKDWSPPGVPVAGATPLYNMAPVVQQSACVQQLVAAGVSVAHWENDPQLLQLAASLDFRRDVAPFVSWLLSRLKFPAEHIAQLISQNPRLLKVPLDDLQVRLNYMQWKRFCLADIGSMVVRNCKWLLHSTKQIDTRLGFFQKRFQLTGSEVRSLAVKDPKLITYNLRFFEENRFTIHEEFGFTAPQMKLILLSKPKVYRLRRESLQKRLDFLLNKMEISHERLARESSVLQCRAERLRPRHLLLQSLNRNQYDPDKAGYIPLIKLASLTDQQFCQLLAHVPVSTYHEFLKSL